MTGSPLALTIRDKKFRMVWLSQRVPFSPDSTGSPAAPALYDLTRFRAGVPAVDIAARSPELTRRWTEKLQQYLNMQSEGWTAKGVQ